MGMGVMPGESSYAIDSRHLHLRKPRTRYGSGAFLVSGCVADGWLPAGRVRRAAGFWGGNTVDRHIGEIGQGRVQAGGVGAS